jgi:uncharacterized protein YcbK (DUF882 family)
MTASVSVAWGDGVDALIVTIAEWDVAGLKGQSQKSRTRARPVVRAGFRVGAAAFVLLLGAGSVKDASAVGETRTLSFHHTHSGEDLTVTFKRNGRYDEEGLKKLNWFLRDWRSQDQTRMNPQLFDIVWEVYRDVDGKEPVQIISSYRSPKTNAMLHRRSSGVARFSQHMHGNAMDFFIPGVSLERIRFAGLRLQRGGVGFYPTSGSPFVHLDTGSIRHWPRMTRNQLVRVFPNGRTVHLPADSGPLPGYQLALADIGKRKSGDGADFAPQTKRNAIASLLGLQSAGDEEEAASAKTPARDAAATDGAKRADENPKAEAAASVPTPRQRPAQTFRLAAADTRIKAADAVSASRRAPDTTKPAASSKFDDPIFSSQPVARADSETKPRTPADIINSRGFWADGTSDAKGASAEPQVTASVAPSSGGLQVDRATREALAFAPPSLIDQRHIVASAGSPSIATAAVSSETSAVASRPQGSDRNAALAADTRMSPSRSVLLPASQEMFLRALILAPSARNFLAVSALNAPDLITLRVLFTKPRMAMATTFATDDPAAPTSDRFSGSAYAALATVTFPVHTASLK